MNWFQQNRWLGTFLIVVGVCTLAAGYFLFHAKSGSDDALTQFNQAAAERGRLERLDPYPKEANVAEMKKHLQNYAQALDKLKADLKTKMLPAPPLDPNEFQSRLRQSIVAVSEKARANRVKLPENFALGFEEFTAALPNSPATAQLLGQELAQVELLLNMIIEARVDAITALVRTPLPEERGPAATPTPAAGRKPTPTATPASGAKLLERGIVDVTFDSTPSAARKVLNQLASSNQQFFITRTVHIKNERDKGPARELPGAGASATPAATATPAKPAAGAALSFIVGNEHIETSARIELVRFTF
jgi:hypothetical protein